jgi:hypothetical protein
MAPYRSGRGRVSWTGVGLTPNQLVARKLSMSRLSHSEVHMVHRIGWLRAAVLGANDGIISTSSLVVDAALYRTGSGDCSRSRPVSVARQIGEYHFGTGEGRLGVDHPALLPDRRQVLQECPAFGQVRH